jgi:hypothetical protein
MLTPGLPVEPYWLDFSYGVRVDICPITIGVMAAVQPGSAHRLGALWARQAYDAPLMATGLNCVQHGLSALLTESAVVQRLP